MGINYKLGRLEKGPKNNICDVKGVRVGHKTLSQGQIQTGVTAIIPGEGNLFERKLEAGVSILNGFGKSAGLVQIEELGNIETPLILTNTLSVGTGLNALVRHMLEANPEIGLSTGTVNPVVLECNDGRINDIRGLHIREEDVLEALESAQEDFQEGSLGAGRGMVCFGLKGGIGSSSRIVKLDRDYVLGALVLSNFGEKGSLRLDGKRIALAYDGLEDHGSIIIVIATDIPLKSRQLRRVASRSAIALGRTGSIMGNGSGDIALAFSTASRLSHSSDNYIVREEFLHENYINRVFEACCDAVEEAIYSSLYHSEATTDRKGELIHSLREYWDE